MEDEKSEGWKRLVKVKVTGDRETEICSVRKEERRREMLAGCLHFLLIRKNARKKPQKSLFS